MKYARPRSGTWWRPISTALQELTNASDFDPMVKIAISRAAYAVIASALPGSSLRVEPQPCRRAYVRWLAP